MKKNLIRATILSALAFPMVASAQGALNQLDRLIVSFGNIVDRLIPIVFTLGILAFFWGLVKYIFAQSSEDSKKDAKNIMIWSLVALFIMTSVFGIIKLARDTLNITDTNGGSIRIPSVTR